jgi:ergothioneine biosynthesis protein EgtB
MPAASPTKWHRAHTTWFFEAFVLAPRGVPPVDPRSGYLWNSYYDAVGPRHPRPERGLLSRPSAREVGAYRRRVDERVAALLATLDEPALDAVRPLVELGLAHEEQHQELVLTDILHAFSRHPSLPAYRGRALPPARDGAAPPLRFVRFPGGMVEVGARPGAGFAFDVEGPRHREWLEPFELATRLVTVGEVRAFIEAGGYETPSLWLSEGWDAVRAHGWRAPLHARVEGGEVRVFGLDGERVASDAEPACHVSYYEADAIARFLGARLPTEGEWEAAAGAARVVGNFLEDGELRALPARGGEAVAQLFGDAWEWTRSAYGPYPGYRPAEGALGEYNGKFMVGQLVLRGGSCFTPRAHVRPSYRNFWPPDTRFQVAGVRLARDVAARA